MKRFPVPASLRRQIFHKAQHRCGYCLTPQSVIGPLLELEHLIPLAIGGTNDENNLWVACPVCNGAKSDRISAPDPETNTIVPLFNPSKDFWKAHFCWQENGTIILGLTQVGRATVSLLNMNHPDMVLARQLWVSAGWHPPKDSL